MNEKWKSISGIDLKKGDILRTPLATQKEWKGMTGDRYLYSICSGSGFGCRHDALGNAIFVHHETAGDLRAVLNASKVSKDDTIGGCRWERSWGDIEVMVNG